MRKIVYFAMISLDGFIATPNGELDWVIVDRELHEYVNDQQSQIGAYLYGRRMYDLMAAAWPAVDGDPSAPDYMVEFARIWKQMPKIVFSKTLDRVEWNSRLVTGDTRDEILRLRAEPGKDLEVGGAGLAGSLMQLGLIDEFSLFVHPVVLGAGIRPFSEPSEGSRLTLLQTRTFKSGVVYLRYRLDHVAGHP